MKNYIFLALIFMLLNNQVNFAQNEKNAKLTPEQIYQFGYPTKNWRTVEINCSPTLVVNNCNYILNNQFNTNPAITDPSFNLADPFAVNQIPDWANSHASPQVPFTPAIFTFPSPPPGASNYAFMLQDGLTGRSEGIVTKIPPLVAGNRYLMRFYISQVLASANPDFFTFNIRLIHCSDYMNFNWGSEFAPAVPPNSQPIYCQTGFYNPQNWQNSISKFIANSDYDMIWIYPESTPGTGSLNGSFACFALPEFIDADNFHINMNPNPPTPNNCMVTLTPSCTVSGAGYVWTAPNGSTFTGNQLTFDSGNSANVGYWTVTQLIGGITPTNSQCGNLTFNLTASIYVPNCNRCIDLPLIQ